MHIAHPSLGSEYMIYTFFSGTYNTYIASHQYTFPYVHCLMYVYVWICYYYSTSSLCLSRFIELCRTISLPPLFSKIYTVDLLLLLPAVFVLADSLNYVEVVEPSPFLPYFLKYLDLLLLPPAVFAAADSLN